MMPNQLVIILSRLLKFKPNNHRLLCPVCCLKQIIEFEFASHGFVWETGVHPCNVEIPDRGSTHDEDANGTEKAEVQGGVGLLHKAELFRAGFELEMEREGEEEALHDEFAGEG